MTSITKYWFRSKRFGFGWTPNTLEGWTVTIVYTIIAVYAFVEVHADYPTIKQNLIAGMPTFGFATFIFLLICYKKGEPLRFRFGR